MATPTGVSSNIENGRILDNDQLQLKAALREVCTTFKPGIRLTAHQSILFTDLPADARGPLEAMLRKHGVKLSEEISNVRRWSMACVAWPTCGLSITESERALPGMIDELEVELAKLGLSKEVFTLRMTGCPNGCARPYMAEIGFVGKGPGRYQVWVGGNESSTRINRIYKEMVKDADIVPELKALFQRWKTTRVGAERFGDWAARVVWAELEAAAAAPTPAAAPAPVAV